jgi:PHD/YefM family antitoxin component YafN of YafNO toxin-antitoxin module
MESAAMIRPQDIGSLTEFQRNTQAHLKRLKRTGRPELLTVNGKAEVVVQNASAYQRLIESLEKFKRDSLRKMSSTDSDSYQK